MKVLVTRPEPEASYTAEKLLKLGHKPFILPVIKINFATEISIIPNKNDLVLFTSINGVRALSKLLYSRDISVLCIGASTAESAKSEGYTNVLVLPEKYGGNSKGLIEYINELNGFERVIHFSGAEIAGDFCKINNYINEVVYKALEAEIPEKALISSMLGQKLDSALFFSPRSAAIFMRWIKEYGFQEYLFYISALAISKPVAEKLGECWKEVKIANKPEQDALLALIP